MQSHVDLLDYASKQLDFEQEGNDLWRTHCPLHLDINPSLKITPSKNLFHCFSCGIGGSVLSWMMKIEKLSYDEAVQKLLAITGKSLHEFLVSDSVKFYKEVNKMIAPNLEKPQRIILPESTIDNYSNEAPEEWVEEGIKPEVMAKYKIRVDQSANRIVYPVWDNDDNLIGFKGRTRYKNFAEMRIAKYMNYQKLGVVDYFGGMHENRQAIKAANEAIIFEGIKSGLKMSGWGYDNWLSSETNSLNEYQIIILISLEIRDVTIAWDNDVKTDHIMSEVRELSKFLNVYMIRDRDKLLGESEDKMAPVDKGREVWERLYAQRKRCRY